jgi:hypothetical protein
MLYIKGYKVNLDKITRLYGVTSEEDPDNTRFLDIVRIFPRESYKYIGGGFESDGRLEFVVVLDEGNDKATLENSPMPEFDQKGTGEILTAGVWKKY